MKFKVGKRYLVVDVKVIYFSGVVRTPIEILILSITPSERTGIDRSSNPQIQL
jgi:hypothetical protein